MSDSILPGSLVRSLDFPHTPRPEALECYMDGILVRVLERGEAFPIPCRVGEPVGPTFHDCDRYVIRVLRHVFNGEIVPPPADVLFAFPPVNGTPRTFGVGPCDGVFSLDEQAIHNV